MDACWLEPVKILLVEDNPGDVELLRHTLRQVPGARFELVHVTRLTDAIKLLRQEPADVLLVDLGLPDSQGLDTVRHAHAESGGTPIIVFTGSDDEALGVEAVRLGAQDYLVKGESNGWAMRRAIRYAIERKHVCDQLKTLNETLEHRVAECTAEAQRRAEQLQMLAGELAQVEQRERRQLADILHDHLQQLLVGAKFHVATAHDQVYDARSLLRSLQQIDELLDQSIEASRSLTVELNPPALYADGFDKALHWLARWMAEKHGLRVEVLAEEHVEPDEQVRVLLFQSVRELLFNVVKHAQVRQAHVEMTQLDDGRIRVLVSDGGVGFDSATVLAGAGLHGSGLGLFSIHERMELLGGHLEIRSDPGLGTDMTLVAPLHLPTQAGHLMLTGVGRFRPSAPEVIEVAHADQAEPEHGRIRVLLVDDHEVVRRGLAGLLENQPDILVVGEAGDGLLAIELARQHRPDVVVMDVSMPGMDGIDAARRILDETPQIQVIGLSMHEEPDVAARMRGAGAATFVNKASPTDELIAAIHQCVAGAR